MPTEPCTYFSTCLFSTRAQKRLWWSQIIEQKMFLTYFKKIDGVLYGQKFPDPALMRIRLNIVRFQELGDNTNG
jgi:hypothetical protein